MKSKNMVKYSVKMVMILLFLLLVVFSSVSFAASEAHDLPQMVYRIRVANDLDFMESKFSGIKVRNIRVPAADAIKIEDNPWSYLVVYIGIENIWFYQGNEMLHAVEAGLSIRGTEVNDGSGWHPFVNYYPKKKYPPFQDPQAWRGKEIDTDGPLTLELRVDEVEQVKQSYRWNVHFYVNGEELAVRPIYANPGESNQFDVKLCVGTYMASGDENEVSFAPFKLGDIHVTESTTYHKMWKKIELEDFGIPKHRIGYGTELNNTENREFITDFEGEDYSYSVAMGEVEKTAEDETGSLLLFALLAGLIAAN